MAPIGRTCEVKIYYTKDDPYLVWKTMPSTVATKWKADLSEDVSYYEYTTPKSTSPVGSRLPQKILHYNDM